MDNANDLMKMFFNALATKAPPNDGDYLKDGLIFCGKCNAPKQCRSVVEGEEIVYLVWCDCMKRADAEEKRQRKEIERMFKTAELRRLSMMGDKLSKCTFSGADKGSDNARSFKICERYVEKFPQMLGGNRGLLLFGGVGTGKTFAAACIANALLEQNYSVVMTSLVTLIDGTDEIVRRMNEIDLLILDDLGAERSTDYGFERIYSVCDARYRSNKPVIYTSNLPLDTFKHSEDIRCARIYDRVLERCYPVEFRGVSRRKKEARRRFEEMTKLLEV